MKLLQHLCLWGGLILTGTSAYAGDAKVPSITPLGHSKHLEVKDANVTLLKDLDLLVFEMTLNGRVGGVLPEKRGALNGAPVLGYVFPTTLRPKDVGFDTAEGTVALAVTSHPDFDDTPLWDEDGDSNYGNDGIIFHTHWVVLTGDKRVPGGLAVLQFKKTENVVLPPTNPGMPMYMDSPGLPVVVKKDQLKVLVPLPRVRGNKSFNFDAVAVYMQVMQTGDFPLLGVYKVYSVLSGDLSLPYKVEE